VRGPTRPRRLNERGLTLIELLVSIAILSIIGGAVAVAFSVAIKTLGAGGAGDRIAGTHDLSAFEQQLGGDVARAACVSKSPATSASAVGTCTKLLNGTPGSCGSASTSFFCVAWPAWSDGGSGTCHTAVYSQSGAVITRSEYGGSVLVRTTHVTTDAVTASVSLTTAPSPSNPSKNWVSLVTVGLTSLGVAAGKSPAAGSLLLHPLAMDPTTAAVSPIC
jgi:prepilin-type N-terminal cleavage/methylation domain-containing protein